MLILKGKDRLDQLASDPDLRKAGWNNGAASRPITDEVVATARQILEMMDPNSASVVQIVPTVSGALQFEWPHVEQERSFEIKIRRGCNITDICAQINQGLIRAGLKTQ